MTSAISNKSLLDKCRRYIITDTSRGDIDFLIKDAIITAFREISRLGVMPLAWNKENYDLKFTNYHAVISAITNANPGIITALSQDPATGSFPYTLDFTFPGHYFNTNDIVYFEGINGVHKSHDLNSRLFRVVSVSDMTLSLKALNGQTVIDSTSFEEYQSGGIMYHAGLILPSSIEPTGGTASYEWDIKRVYGVEVDGYQCDIISEEGAIREQINRPGGCPRKWRYQQYSYAGFTSIEHMVMWYPFPAQRYNMNIMIEKDYPDISVWTSEVYPPMPPFVHDFIWHRALANLATHNQAARRRSSGKEGEFGDNTKVEVLNANFWVSKVAEEERKILEYSRNMDGNQPYQSQGMSA